MIDTIDSLLIKSFLKQGPFVPLSTQPLFRLVWSDDQYELRTGTFGKFVDNIKIAEYQATEQVLKYSWIKERWIVEQWFPPEVCLLDELPESKQGSFEPIYVFETSKGAALPLKLEVIQFLVQASLKPKTSMMRKQSLSKENTEAREKIAQDITWDCINDDGPLVSQFHDGTAILRP